MCESQYDNVLTPQAIADMAAIAKRNTFNIQRAAMHDMVQHMANTFAHMSDTDPRSCAFSRPLFFKACGMVEDRPWLRSTL